MKELLSYKQIRKQIESDIKLTVKCKCGHSVTIKNRYNCKICNWCGKMVYLDPRDEFKNKMKGVMKKNDTKNR